MFTGIVQEVGEVVGLARRGEDVRIRVDARALDMSDVATGESIAVNGVCLTAIELTARGFAADVSRETLSCTTLAGLSVGDAVNLEKALLPTTRLGGHLVSGHVDGVGEVAETREVGGSCRVSITLPGSLARYVAPKGSICVDGVSLTVNAVSADGFEVNLIPHTMEKTVMKSYRRGTSVNIEVDLVARYLERLLSAPTETAAARGVTEGFLAEHGFIDG